MRKLLESFGLYHVCGTCRPQMRSNDQKHHRIQVDALQCFEVRVLSLLGILVCFSTQSYGEEVDRALAYLPDSVNCVGVVRVQEILKSPRAVQEQWHAKNASEFLAGGLEAGAAVNTIVRGLEFHPDDSHLTSAVSVISFAKSISLSQLAKRDGGHLDKISGKSAVHSTHGGYLIGFDQRILGHREPSYRQDVTRWVRKVSDQTEPTFSKYLQQAVQQNGAPVVIALDLADVIDPHTLRIRLVNSSLFHDATHRESLAKLLETLQGLRVVFNVTDQIEAQVFVDFGIVPGQKLGESVQPLLIEVLSRSGAMIEELDEAQGRIEGKSVVLKMNLKDATARQILSLVFTSSQGSDAPTESDPDPVTAPLDRQIIKATESYLASVNRLVDDLQKKSERNANYQKSAVWHETYAKRIDELSVRNVDPDALAYAASVSSKLRALAVSLRGVPIEVNRLQHSISYDVQYTPWAAGVSVWGGFGYRPPTYNVQTNQGAIQAQQAEAIANGEKSRIEVWKLLADERQALRVKLQGKYNLDIEAP